MTRSDSTQSASSAAKFRRIKAAVQSHQGHSVEAFQSVSASAPQLSLADREFSATDNQTGIWFLSQDQGHGGTYSVARQLRLQGALDESALGLAVADLVARHSILRSTLNLDDSEIVQRISGDANVDRYFEVQDASVQLAPDATSEQRLEAALARTGLWYQRDFDLEAGPLFRVLLCRLSDHDHLLVLNAHHAITDGWSQSLMLEELAICYNARRSGSIPCFPDVAPQFATLSKALDGALPPAAVEEALAEWEQKLSGLPDCIELPLDKPRPSQSSGAGGRCEFRMAADDFEAVRALASERRTTPFCIFMSAFMLLLFKLSGQGKIAVGVPLANREDPDAKRTVGYLANTLPLVAEIDAAMSGNQLIAAVTEALFDSLRLQHTPFGKLVQRLNPKRDTSYHPVFQLAFSLQPDRGVTAQFDGLTAAVVPRTSVASRFDLTLMLDLGTDRTSFFMDYAADLFHQETIERWVADMVRALRFFSDRQDRSIAEFALTAPAAGGVDQAGPSSSVSTLFEGAANRFKNKAALTIAGDPGQTLSYTQLQQFSSRLADALVSSGTQVSDRIALCLPRSFNAVIAMLGILKAGATYVPIDPEAPAERRRRLLLDSGAKLVITNDQYKMESTDAVVAQWRMAPDHDVLPPVGIRSDLPVRPAETVGGDAAACLLFTSGSTGSPKGVLVPHRAIVRLVRDATYAKLAPETVMLHMAPLDFDAATFELWGPLLNGGTCVVYSDRVPDPLDLQRAIAEQNVTTAWITSALFNAIIDEMPQALAGLKELFTGGEALSVPHIVRALRALPGVAISNCYGPTENGTFTTVYRISPDFAEYRKQVPIGMPIAGRAVHVLDEHQRPVQQGDAGELWVSGAGVALGYLNHPDDGAFRKLPAVAQGLMYRTGDRVKQLADGNYEFIGRSDDQVKINGFRVELGEVEHALRSLPGVRDAAVAVQELSGDKQLCAFIISSEGLADDGSGSIDRVRASLAEVVPRHMLPQSMSLVARLPRTTTGKIDRQALVAGTVGKVSAEVPDSGASPASSTPSSEADLDAVSEGALLEIWREILNQPTLQPDDNFFSAGGHSIMAVRLMARVEQRFGRRLPLGTLFEAPSVSGQLAMLSPAAAGDASPASRSDAVVLDHAEPVSAPGPIDRWSLLVPIKPAGSLAPLFMVHAIGGQVHGFNHFVAGLPDDLPVYGIQCRGYEPGQAPHHDLVQMAADYVAEVRQKQPHGPYFLGGLSFGGLVAFEMAAQLERSGERVAFLLIGDTFFSDGAHIDPVDRLLARFPVPPLRALPAVWRWFWKHKMKSSSSLDVATNLKNADPLFAARSSLVHAAHLQAVTTYDPPRIGADVTLVSADTYPRSRATKMRLTGSAAWGWNKLTKGTVSQHVLPGTHHTMFYGADAVQFPAVVTHVMATLPDVVVARMGRERQGYSSFADFTPGPRR